MPQMTGGVPAAAARSLGGFPRSPLDPRGGGRCWQAALSCASAAAAGSAPPGGQSRCRRRQVVHGRVGSGVKQRCGRICTAGGSATTRIAHRPPAGRPGAASSAAPPGAALLAEAPAPSDAAPSLLHRRFIRSSGSRRLCATRPTPSPRTARAGDELLRAADRYTTDSSAGASSSGHDELPETM